MLKRWAAWPRGNRWLAGIAAVVLALAVAWALFVPIADWLAHHDVGSATGPLHETAVDNARGRLLTLARGRARRGCARFTARNFDLSREGQVTDRYTKAIEQLGSDKLDVRIGGIYALERIARDSARDHPTVMEVLSAFIREHSREQWHRQPSRDGADPRLKRFRLGGRLVPVRPDVQAAVTVVGRRDASATRANRPSGANLADPTSSTRTSGARSSVRTSGSRRSPGAPRQGDSRRANSARQPQRRVPPGGEPDRSGPTPERTYRCEPQRRVPPRRRPYPRGPQRRGPQRREPNDVDLSGADLTGAKWPEDTPVPEGWKRDTGSGRLEPDPVL